MLGQHDVKLRGHAPGVSWGCFSNCSSVEPQRCCPPCGQTLCEETPSQVTEWDWPRHSSPINYTNKLFWPASTSGQVKNRLNPLHFLLRSFMCLLCNFHICSTYLCISFYLTPTRLWELSSFKCSYKPCVRPTCRNTETYWFCQYRSIPLWIWYITFLIISYIFFYC